MLISGTDMFNENTMNINILPCWLFNGWRKLQEAKKAETKVPKQFVIGNLQETQKERCSKYYKYFHVHHLIQWSSKVGRQKISGVHLRKVK